MTYKQLQEMLATMPTERLHDTVTVFDQNSGEFFGANDFTSAEPEETNVLDEGHFYLTIG